MKSLSFFIISVILIIIHPIKLQTRIPSYLQECYDEKTFRGPHLPLNLQTFIDIIRKAETYSDRSIDLRIFTSSLLHRFKFDGIEWHKDLKFEDGVLPFGGTGPQRTKNQIIEELVPGNYKQFPDNVLTKLERCALHRALSNTISEDEDPANDKFCMERPTEKISGMMSCPLEFGVILTPYGTVAPGALIAGIAAALQPQTVAVKLLLNIPDEFNYHDYEVDIMIPKSEMTPVRSMWLNSILASDTKLDNVWTSTVAGDLAEMAVHQGPSVGNRMLLGATGFWNSSIRPQIFYLLGKDGSFDATRAEIVGAIDGFIIAKHLKHWTSNFTTLRLSELLSMYYSRKGITFDSTVKACNRGESFWYMASTTILEQQVYATSQILAYRRSAVHMTDEVLKKMVHYSVTKFSDYVNNHLFPEIHCITEKHYPKVEVLVTSDGAWSHEYTADFLAILLEDLNVSPFGSNIGLIEGTTGEWLLNVTNSFSSAHSEILNQTSSTKLNLAKIFDVATDYYTSKWNERHKNHTVGGLGQAIVILAPLIRLSEPEVQESLISLRRMRSLHPDVHVIYYTTPEKADPLRRFLISQKDYLLTSLRINDISAYLLEVPNSIRPGPCNPNVTLGIRDQVEGYVYPQEVITYRLDPLWRANTKRVTVKIVGFGYGSLEICMWNQRGNSATRKLLSCRELSGNEEEELTDFHACREENCPAIFYKVRGLSSTNKCAEIDCRTPEHIRYLLRMENLQCSTAKKLTPSLIAPLLLLFFTSIKQYLS
ncbi:uncharacterized protein LOC107047901 isoform X2 [Diachasma alloeum]|uniref:uncharacterized protein LOC107047901 isoform X2 n=1 Tax=Diachasma alloeum TaxID=454923 RepID=UPI0007382E1F|nr:uncharacterized protein LOC107047901 isoform X2 [Diachasma alloeum]